MKKLVCLCLLFCLFGCKTEQQHQSTKYANRYFVTWLEEPFDKTKFCTPIENGEKCTPPDRMVFNEEILEKIKADEHVETIRPFWQFDIADPFTISINGETKTISGQRSASSVAMMYDDVKKDGLLLAEKKKETHYISGYLNISQSSDLLENAYMSTQIPELGDNQYIYHLTLFTEIKDKDGNKQYVEKTMDIEIIGFIDGYSSRGSIFVNEKDMEEILSDFSLDNTYSDTYIVDLKNEDSSFFEKIDPRLLTDTFN